MQIAFIDIMEDQSKKKLVVNLPSHTWNQTVDRLAILVECVCHYCILRTWTKHEYTNSIQSMDEQHK